MAQSGSMQRCQRLARMKKLQPMQTTAYADRTLLQLYRQTLPNLRFGIFLQHLLTKRRLYHHTCVNRSLYHFSNSVRLDFQFSLVQQSLSGKGLCIVLFPYYEWVSDRRLVLKYYYLLKFLQLFKKHLPFHCIHLGCMYS